MNATSSCFGWAGRGRTTSSSGYRCAVSCRGTEILLFIVTCSLSTWRLEQTFNSTVTWGPPPPPPSLQVFFCMQTLIVETSRFSILKPSPQTVFFKGRLSSFKQNQLSGICKFHRQTIMLCCLLVSMLQ